MNESFFANLLAPIDSAPLADRGDALDRANRSLDLQWPHLSPALAHRAAALLELRQKVYDEEIRSF